MFFRKSKKLKKLDLPPVPEPIPDDCEEKLLEQKEQLEEKLRKLKVSKSVDRSEMGLWGVVAGGAIAADMALLGGMGIGLFVLTSTILSHHKEQARETKKKLEELEEKILKYQELKKVLQPTAPAKTFPAKTKKDFKAAAKPAQNDPKAPSPHPSQPPQP